MQDRVLKAICEIIKENGKPMPTGEIAKRIGMTTSFTHRKLQKLCKKRILKRFKYNQVKDRGLNISHHYSFAYQQYINTCITKHDDFWFLLDMNIV